jgi:hypothetical protein
MLLNGIPASSTARARTNNLLILLLAQLDLAEAGSVVGRHAAGANVLCFPSAENLRHACC